MKKPPSITDEERELFRNEVKGAKPLKAAQKISIKKSQRTQPAKPQSVNKQLKTTPQRIQLRDSSETQFQANEYLFYSRTGIQQKRLRDLRQGKLAIEATIDLHGKTSEQAKLVLEQFLSFASDSNKRVVQIIHGKGQRDVSTSAILKNKVYGWLVECDEVLAFCSCQAKHGGAGAVYVLLKANR